MLTMSVGWTRGGLSRRQNCQRCAPAARLRRNSKVRQSLPYRLAALAIPSGADGPTPICLGNLKEPDTRYRGFSRRIKG